MNHTETRRLLARGLQACDVRPRELLLLSAIGVLSALFRVVSMSLFLPLVYAAFSDSSSPRGRFGALLNALPLDDLNLIYVLSGIILITGLVAAMLGFLTEYLEARLSYHGLTTLSRRIFRRFLAYGQAYSDRNGPNIQLRELRRVPRKVSRQVKVLGRHLRAALEILVYSAALLLLAWPLALACFLALIVYYLAFGRLLSWIESHGSEDDQDEEAFEDRAADVLLNLPLVRGAGTSRLEKKEWRKFQQQRLIFRKRAFRFQAAIKPVRQLVALLAMLVFVLALSFGLGGLEVYDAVRFIVFFLFLRRLMTAFSKVLEIPSDWHEYKRLLKNYADLMEQADKGIVKSGSHILGPLTSPIEINNLTFSYRDVPALKAVNVSFPLNECSAVVGLSGSGKSTLLKLLARQYEVEAGRILLNGRSIEEYTRESLSNECVYLGSDPQFFNKSIEYNLCYGLDDVSSEEMLAALEQSAAADFISTLESGLQTVMGLKEHPFSRGQLQRLGIARLLMQRHASLFLLDEATSALDEATEQSILKQMKLRPNTTVIFVTHRVTVIDPDMHVAVFHQGQVVEQGRRKELEATAGSHFAQLRHIAPTAVSDTG